MVQEYVSLLNFIQYPADITATGFYPFLNDYNIAYHISYNLWQIIGGFLAWLVNCLFPNNWLSTWLICPEASALFALVLFMLLIFIVAFVNVLIVLWFERKWLGRMMDRRGTMIGMKGFLQCVGDGLKTFMKENTAPRKIDKMTYWWCVALIVGLSCFIACMVPLSDRWYAVNYDTGILIIMAFYALAPFIVLVAGWSQNNKYSLIGGIRAAEIMISYEVPMLIIIASCALMAGSLNIGDIVVYQSEHVWFFIPQILGFITFFFCSVAECERIPFDLAEAESELVEGWQTEYAGMKWGLIMLADYLRGTVSCGMTALLFLGGWMIPFTTTGGPLPEIVFLVKAWFVFFLMVQLRGGVGRIRTDQILNLGWKVFMPLSVLNLAIVLVLKVGGIC